MAISSASPRRSWATYYPDGATTLSLATKFTFQTDPKAGILVTGNSRRSMVSSVEASLKRLKTDRIDLYWAHVSDGVTPFEEIVRGFDDLARAGKILYAGLSDFPAWRVARAATIAELRGVTPIAGLQVEHSLVERTTEQELLPAGQALGLGIVAWSPLGGGVLTGKYRQGEKGRREGFGGRVFQEENSPHRTAILDTLIAVAKDAGVTPAEIAIAWVAAKGSLPIIGPRTLAQLENNLAATKVTLSPAQIARLDEVSAIPAVFPFRMFNKAETRQGFTGGKLEQFDAPAAPSPKARQSTRFVERILDAKRRSAHDGYRRATAAIDCRALAKGHEQEWRHA